MCIYDAAGVSTHTKRGMPLTCIRGSWRLPSRRAPEEEEEEAVVGCTFVVSGLMQCDAECYSVMQCDAV